LASAFALYTYFTSDGGTAGIIYGGKFPFTKPSLLEMVHKLGIPAEFVRQAPRIDVLVVVDGQYGAENVTRFDADTVYVIDHHAKECNAEKCDEEGVINQLLGSCSTLVWDLLRKEAFDLTRYPNASTALYYGLYTDTSGFAEIYHPLDKDMRDFIACDSNIIKQIINAAQACKEHLIAGVTLRSNNRTDCDLRYSVLKADPCDLGVLSSISDLALQEDGCDACIAYCCLTDGIRVSVSSRVREIMASDYVEFIADNVGFGGGCPVKGSGFVKETAVKALGLTDDEYIDMKAKGYFTDFDMVNAGEHSLDVLTMPKYRKKEIPVGYVRSTSLFAAGSPIMLRTLEGDAEATVSDDIYIMVGVLGEAYPIKAEKFERTYKLLNGTLEKNYVYSPTVRNRLTGEVRELAEHISPCAACGSVIIRAVPVNKSTKVFTAWHKEGYMLGKAGDYIAVRADDINDVYIVRRDIFDMTYETV
jgi:phosphoglycolate phosphatase